MELAQVFTSFLKGSENLQTVLNYCYRFDMQPSIFKQRLLVVFDLTLQLALSEPLPELNLEIVSNPVFSPSLSKGQIYAYVCGARPQPNNPRTSDGFRRRLYERYFDILRSITQEVTVQRLASIEQKQIDMWLSGTSEDVAFADHHIKIAERSIAAIEEMKQEANNIIFVLDNSRDTLYDLGIDFIKPITQTIQFQSATLIQFEQLRKAN